MERVEQFKSIKIGHCTLFSVLRSVTLDFRFQTTLHTVKMQINEVVQKITQKCHEHIYGESCAIPVHQNGPLYTILVS